MKLIDLLVKELPKRGGWPEGAARLAQDPDGDIQMLSNRHAYLSHSGWTGDGRVDFRGQYAARKIEPLSSDHTTAIITREQYESALAASDEWIEWGGGECPVGYEVLVECIMSDGTMSDRAEPAHHFRWDFAPSEPYSISKYRLHKPDINSRANDDRLEQDLNECIGQGVQWQGDGVPPVGTVCMANLANGWTDVKVAYIGDEGGCREALVFEIKSTKPAWADEFRPLRTEAEKAREAACHEIASMIGRGTFFEDAERVYDAGYRKENK